ncbi:hypothetical protein [Schleiferilactobacillus perolens]|uniref:hypothetical protein n=1 Tax=Schleiferilactobacillus perolens TaxID=100468 RepID=UPI0039E7F010
MREKMKETRFEKEYAVTLNKILARFTMFDDVFGEYKRTVQKITRGRCLASENLKDLAGYWHQNCEQFHLFLERIGTTPAPAEFMKLHRTLLAEMRNYYNGVCTAQQAINWMQNSCCQTTLQSAFSELTEVKERIDETLEGINGVAM